MTRYVCATIVAITSAIALSGCAPGNDIKDQGVGAVTRDASAETASNLALISGELAVENGCVILEDGTVPVFAADDVTWDGSTLRFGEVDYVVGDTISLGGGELSADARAELVPDECGAGPGWGVAPTEHRS